MVTLMLFYLFYIAGLGINNFGDSFFASQQLEDANFTTYLEISEEELASLEKEYSLTLEAQHSLDLTEGDTTIRVFSPNSKIDLYQVTEGEDLSDENQLLISQGYAQNMGVELGDTITLQGKAFTVVGYFQRPDYLYMLEDPNDSYKNVTTFFLAIVSEEALSQLGTASTTYLVQYGVDNSTDFRKAVNDNYYMQSYLAADENMRILMVHQQADMFMLMSFAILILMPLVAVLLVCIMISRKIKDEQKLIGTLTAFGYGKGQIIRHYALLAGIPGFGAGALSLMVTKLIQQPYGELALSDYEPMQATFSLPLSIGLLGIAIPTAMYIAAATLSAVKLLQADPVDMLGGKAGGETSLKGMLRKSSISFRTKLALRNLLGNPARALAVLVGIFMGSTILLVTFAIVDSVNHISQDSLDSLGSYEYEYVLSSLLTGEPEDGSPLLVSSLETEDGSRITFMGITEENPYLNLTTTDGRSLTQPDGYYISSAAATLLSIGSGDTVVFYNPLSLEQTEITITDVVEYAIGSVVFTSQSNMTSLLGLENGTYNAVMSDQPLTFADGLLRQTVHKSAIIEQCNNILEEMGLIIYTFVVLGMLICVSAIYAVVNMLMQENRKNISMLKVLGYQDCEISNIILRTNHVLLPLGIVAGIPVAYAVLDALWMMFMEYGAMQIQTYIQPSSYVLTVLLTGACYFGALRLVGQKIKKVSMEESLKDQRE